MNRRAKTILIDDEFDRRKAYQLFCKRVSDSNAQKIAHGRIFDGLGKLVNWEYEETLELCRQEALTRRNKK